MISSFCFVGSSFRARLARFAMVFLVAVSAYMTMLSRAADSEVKVVLEESPVAFTAQVMLASSE